MKLGMTIVLAAGVVSGARGDVYTTTGAFLANVQPGYYGENLTSVPPGIVGTLNIGPVNGFAYDVSGSSDDLFNGNGFVSTNVAADSLVITFTGAKVTAVGGNFWATDIWFNKIDTNMKIELSNGAVEAFFSTATSDFRGFTSNIPIVKLTIDALDSPSLAWPTMDNLIVGLSAGASCYGDCDGSGALDIDDFICFQTYYAIGDQYADCDGSGSLDIDDFICFQTFYAVGC